MAEKKNNWFEFHFKLTQYNAFLYNVPIDKFELYHKGFSYQEVLDEKKGIKLVKKK
jgi:hypothetical protein